MRIQFLMLLAALSVSLAKELLNEDRVDPSEDAEWLRFKKLHKKKYKNKDRERVRKMTFVKHHREIKEHNSGSDNSHILKVNMFADWSDDELDQLKGEIDTDNFIPGPVVDHASFRDAIIPDEVDLRNSSCMAPVKYQGGCGSCYSFATTNPLEYQRCKKTGNLVILSEENIIDCSQKYGNAGCSGGLALRAWNYVKDTGLTTDEVYPYQGEETLCEYTPAYGAANVASWAYATRNNNEDEIKNVVANNGPVAVSIDATGWEFYGGGVFSNPKCSKTATNHAVVIVGYGVEKNTSKPYWIIRNSWGPDWGLGGYILLERGSNMCAVTKRAVFPTIA